MNQPYSPHHGSPTFGNEPTSSAAYQQHWPDSQRPHHAEPFIVGSASDPNSRSDRHGSTTRNRPWELSSSPRREHHRPWELTRSLRRGSRRPRTLPSPAHREQHWRRWDTPRPTRRERRHSSVLAPTPVSIPPLLPQWIHQEHPDNEANPFDGPLGPSPGSSRRVPPPHVRSAPPPAAQRVPAWAREGVPETLTDYDCGLLLVRLASGQETTGVDVSPARSAERQAEAAVVPVPSPVYAPNPPSSPSPASRSAYAPQIPVNTRPSPLFSPLLPVYTPSSPNEAVGLPQPIHEPNSPPEPADPSLTPVMSTLRLSPDK